MTPASIIPVFGSQRPYADLNFAGGSFGLDGRSVSDLTALPGFTFTRASTAMGFGSDGLLQSFASGAPRLVYDRVTLAPQGILVEEARTNVVLWNRDLTNAAWTKTDITAAKDQTGIDGVASSASKITATAGNGTCLQAITLASSARQQSAWVKRVTGSGVVQMTTDNGTTWAAVTVTASWTQVTIPVQTLANPTVGFRIVTSGDAIAVDFVQNEAGTGASSPIPTTTASVTRAADDVTVTGLSVPYPLSLVTSFTRAFDSGGVNIAAQVDDGVSSANNRTTIQVTTSDLANLFVRMGFTTQADITVAGALDAGTAYGVAGRVGSNDAQMAKAGTLGTQDTVVSSLVTATVLRIGSRSAEYANGTISRIRIYNRALPDAQLQSLTT